MTVYTGFAFDVALIFTNLLFSTTVLGREKYIPVVQLASYLTKLAQRLDVPSSTENKSLSECEKL